MKIPKHHQIRSKLLFSKQRQIKDQLPSTKFEILTNRLLEHSVNDQVITNVWFRLERNMYGL